MTDVTDEPTDNSSNVPERATAHPDVRIGAVYFVPIEDGTRPHEGQFVILDGYDADDERFEGVTEAGEGITIPAHILEGWLADNCFVPVDRPDELAATIREVLI